METEFASLTFLRDNGITNVPKPIIATTHSPLNFAIYSWIEGQPFGPHNLTSASIAAATDFLSQLAELRHHPTSHSLKPAAEAFFIGGILLENIQARLRPLLVGPHIPDLHAFLKAEFLPAFDRLSTWARNYPIFSQELDPNSRTLSPSDFGFHNALLTLHNEIVFLDFEYFGWDDPAKTISDFLLHPAMDLPLALKQQFAATAVQHLAHCPGLPSRVKAFYPLFGLKWCLILLNEFLPDHILRRRFAGMSDQDLRQKQLEQLAKARNMLQRTITEYEHFPYLG
jgi:thiamine kinase-like enzyme